MKVAQIIHSFSCPHLQTCLQLKNQLRHCCTYGIHSYGWTEVENRNNYLYSTSGGNYIGLPWILHFGNHAPAFRIKQPLWCIRVRSFELFIRRRVCIFILMKGRNLRGQTNLTRDFINFVLHHLLSDYAICSC